MICISPINFHVLFRFCQHLKKNVPKRSAVPFKTEKFGFHCTVSSKKNKTSSGEQCEPEKFDVENDKAN